jgi:hypothetical protein
MSTATLQPNTGSSPIPTTRTFVPNKGRIQSSSSSSSFLDRDGGSLRNIQNPSYGDPDSPTTATVSTRMSNTTTGLTSPLSPVSDFSYSRYGQQDSSSSYTSNGPQPRSIQGGYRGSSSTNTFSDRDLSGGPGITVPSTPVTNSLLARRGSNESQATIRDSMMMEHYSALKKYLVHHLASEGNPPRLDP